MDEQGVLAGLERAVRVYRDDWGIPHVRAESVADAFAAQGYVHAADRFWQMDASRMQMQGRWAEWVGAAGIEADALARRYGSVPPASGTMRRSVRPRGPWWTPIRPA